MKGNCFFPPESYYAISAKKKKISKKILIFSAKLKIKGT